MDNNLAYANYKYARKIPYSIVNKLIYDCPELWKLLYYDEPMGKENLTIEQITSMICKDSMNVDKYNVVFQKYSQEAMAQYEGKIFSQMRIQVIDMRSKNRTVGMVSVLFEFPVNNKKMVCSTDLTPFDNRSLAMMQEVIACLNGVDLKSNGNDDGNLLFIDGQIDSSTGFSLVKFNDEFSGYRLIMNSNILG